MKSQTPGGTPDSARAARAGAAAPTCAAVVEMAGLLLAQTTAESQEPINRLSEALSRLARRLLEAGVPLSGAPGAAPADPLNAHWQAIAHDVGICIENLQFHDRLVQQLVRVQDILTSLASNDRLAHVPAVVADPGSIELF